MFNLRLFSAVSDYEAFKNGSDYVLPNVSYIKDTKVVSYDPYVPGPDIRDNYLTIEALEDGLTAKLSVNACEYCVDGDGNWKSLAAGTATESINTGQTLSFRGYLKPATNKGVGTFTINKKCNLKGNCMSMLFGDNAADNYSLEGKDCAFYGLFSNCSNIISVSSNFLPATTLADKCYYDMFIACRSLTTAPAVLPATTLADKCYYGMFDGCWSLTTAPELPATTLADDCYNGMFSGCKSLTTAPELPATTLADDCYNGMFSGCNLTTAPELPATTLAEGCYNGMFSSCLKLTTAPAVLPATTLADRCYMMMFNSCLKLTTAPELPATTLADECYYLMFSGCKSLTTAPELPATTLADKCYYGMFGNCPKLNYIKMLATDISAEKCLLGWVGTVSSTGTFVKNPAMTTLPTGESGIPEGWTVVDAA